MVTGGCGGVREARHHREQAALAHAQYARGVGGHVVQHARRARPQLVVGTAQAHAEDGHEVVGAGQQPQLPAVVVAQAAKGGGGAGLHRRQAAHALHAGPAAARQAAQQRRHHALVKQPLRVPGLEAQVGDHQARLGTHVGREALPWPHGIDKQLVEGGEVGVEQRPAVAVFAEQEAEGFEGVQVQAAAGFGVTDLV